MVQGGAKFSSIINYSIDKSLKDPSGKGGKQDNRTAVDKEQKQKYNNEKNYGAWGPLYKNRQNFNEMHFC
ncbi:hypothetical protein RUM43_007403 [Polyplax serrata]|uniref:Uncharacterized protein n=1 Tax=Polyplax serrata TaxID=468196 RepID=A0AAN8Q605_POLSC